MRKILLIISVLCIISTSTVFADTKSKNVYVNSKLIQVDGGVQSYRDATYVPLSFVKNGLGATTEWKSPIATVKKGSTTLVFTINSNAYTNNGNTLYSEYQPYVSNNIVYLPIKIVTVNLGGNVTQDTATKDLYVDTTKAGSLSNGYIDYNDVQILSNDKKHGYFTKWYNANGINTEVLFTKNMETGEFREVCYYNGNMEVFWTIDNKLLINGVEQSNSKLVKAELLTYNPATKKLTSLATGTDAVYVQSNNSVLYKNNSIFYKLDLGTNKTSTITEKEYTSLKQGQDTLTGPGKYYYFYIDDKQLTLDTPPETYKGSLHVPLSFVGKALGFDVSWSSPYITIKNSDKTVVLQVNSNAYSVNGVTYYSKYKPFISNSRTLVPFRFISNIFGYTVTYTEDYLQGQNRTNATVKIDTTKKFTPDNSFVEDNSTFKLSPNSEYGFKTEGKVVYFKNMKTGEFKELYDCTGNFDVYWINTNQLIISGDKDPFTNKPRENYMLYDPTTDTMKIIVDARYGSYVESLGKFAYSTTKYQSDSTSDVGSSFYLRDMTTGKDTKITQDEYYKYTSTPERYAEYSKYKK